MRNEISEYFKQDYNQLVGFVMRLGAQQSTAEDVAQAAFARACVQWSQITHPRAWLRRVAFRIYYQEVRKTSRLREQWSPASTPAVDPADHAAGCDQVLAALAMLPIRQREVMAWHVDGYEPEQIALELGLTAENVRKALQRARERLKKLLAEQLERGTRDEPSS
ncbi:ECF RNA polymerase sigma factor SigE [Actinomadura sp. RB99]|uniref:sigma-70 family RNA polymerase sigma factor n=1 Tax=Actinomadura sp. RB99 TaxID=2691577 RepID=UPI001686FB2E|nr:ECF RNA polymerase sigma factor SigE [Actinomadura sp. RB99]